MKRKIKQAFLFTSSFSLLFGLFIGVKPRSTNPVIAEMTSRAGVDAEWEPWDKTDSLPTSGYYYLTQSFELCYQLRLTDNLSLDLNGYTITFTGNKSGNTAIVINNGFDLFLYDSIGTGLITKADTAKYDRAFYVSDDNSCFVMNGGKITNFKNSSVNGGAVCVTKGSFEFKGGTIESCKGNDGGAICTLENTTFNMYGGTISNCTASQFGGAICSKGTFTMKNGTISGCTSTRNGGGIYIGSKGTFTINDGLIEDNEASGGNGGGVQICSSSTFTMTGGKIHHNTTVAAGGGIGIAGDNIKATISGGEIYENSTTSGSSEGGGGIALFGMTNNTTNVTISGSVDIHDNTSVKRGGGILLYHARKLNLTGGIIRNNTSKDAGGGICVFGTSYFEMTGGKVCNNTGMNGGGITCNGYGGSVQRFAISGGEICHNTSTTFGGGIAVWNNNGTDDVYAQIFGNVYIHDNIATTSGGGLYAHGYHHVHIYGGIFGKNTAVERCGWGRISDKEVQDTNSLFYRFHDVKNMVGRYYVGYKDQTGQDTTANQYNPVINGQVSTISFNPQGGIGGSTSISNQVWNTNLNQGQNITIPTREGFRFLGYFNDAGDQYFNADGTPTVRGDEGIKWDYVGPVTLYAHWALVGSTTAMKLAYSYVNSPNEDNIFRLMCAVNTTIESFDAEEAGIYIEKEFNGEKKFVARFDFLNNTAYFQGGISQSNANIYSEEVKLIDDSNFTVKYILIDLGDLVADNSNAYAIYTIHSYIKNEEGLFVGEVQSSYSFASLLDTYLDSEGAYYASLSESQIESLEKCKTDLGLN